MKLKLTLIGKLSAYAAFLIGTCVVSWFGGIKFGSWIMETVNEME